MIKTSCKESKDLLIKMPFENSAKFKNTIEAISVQTPGTVHAPGNQLSS